MSAAPAPPKYTKAQREIRDELNGILRNYHPLTGVSEWDTDHNRSARAGAALLAVGLGAITVGEAKAFREAGEFIP